MEQEPERAGERPSSTGNGRTAPAHELALHLPDAPPAYLADALDNPALVPDHVAALLRNRGAPGSVLRRVARTSEWTRLYDVKRGLVAHPNTPPAVSRSLIHHLYWRDLSEIAADLRVHPLLRRRAEELLRVRLTEMAQGERIALARRAVRGLIGPLSETGEPRVLRALLGNPRLVEGDAVRIARAAQTPGEILRDLADDARWGERQAVRLALLRNPRTPVHAGLRVLSRLPRPDVRRVHGDAAVPEVVRRAAAHRLGLTP
jgi:hypothetical protein